MIFVPFLWWVCWHVRVWILLLVDWLWWCLLLKQSLRVHLHRLETSALSFISSLPLTLLLVRSRCLVVWLGIKELLKRQSVVTGGNVLGLFLKLDLLPASSLSLLFPGGHLHLWWVLSEDAFGSADAGSCRGASLSSRTGGDSGACLEIVVVFVQVWLERTVFLLLLKLSKHRIFILSGSVIDSLTSPLNNRLGITRRHSQRLRVQHRIEWVILFCLLLLVVPLF